ncbi:ABC transporter permease [Ammoniphilus sp. CFH 90114]|uniref:ABC transporter permease n=1 Tax=Ammoniphilus sp. CFH 90114 TaxID=2493665 RepID=UPI00100E8AFE|nr:ABC transporter permease subunit [Ammoniphilus sp. CFH 90114]RXT13737.1 ABC transporter permease subunit [Ammoniphilus sp. CFH 90114]
MRKSVIWLATILGFLALLVSILPLLLQSFSAGWSWPHLFPTAYSWRSWIYLFSPSSRTWEAVMNTLVIAFAVTLINLVVSIPAANALARWPMKGKWMMEALLFAPLVVPAFVPMMGIHMTFIGLGLTDTLWGVILAHVIPTVPYVLRALITSYRTLGFEWEEQARMLGARRMQRFYHIVFPHLLPGIAAGAGLSLLVSASQYLITLLIGGGQVITLPLLLFPFISGGDPAVGSAYSLLFVGVALLAMLSMDFLLKGYYAKRNF